MTTPNVTPFLNFDGNAQDAMREYERVLGAKTESLLRFGEITRLPSGMPCPAEDTERVAHAVLRFGQQAVMVSDVPSSMQAPKESNAGILLDFQDAEEMARCFDGLAASGQVVMPVQDTFWGAKFGILVDAFGIRWLFNCLTQGQ